MIGMLNVRNKMHESVTNPIQRFVEGLSRGWGDDGGASIQEIMGSNYADMRQQ